MKVRRVQPSLWDIGNGAGLLLLFLLCDELRPVRTGAVAAFKTAFGMGAP